MGFLLRGASPLGACNGVGVALHAFFHAYDTDETFRERVEEVRDALGWNVASALYRTAMEGNVSAMTNWLKLRPPRDWHTDDDAINTDDLIESLEGVEIVGVSSATRTSLPQDAPNLFPPPSL